MIIAMKLIKSHSNITLGEDTEVNFEVWRRDGGEV